MSGSSRQCALHALHGGFPCPQQLPPLAAAHALPRRRRHPVINRLDLHLVKHSPPQAVDMVLEPEVVLVVPAEVRACSQPMEPSEEAPGW